MIKEYQVTLICSSRRYKPISCIIKNKEIDLNNPQEKRKLILEGVRKICYQKYWDSKIYLKKYGYDTVKVREYNKEKIEAEKVAKYEAIKETKYLSGEWKKPKEKC